MSFFRRMKDRLFKSSSKIDEGLSNLMESGEEAPVEEAPAAPSAAPESPQPARPGPAAPAATPKTETAPTAPAGTPKNETAPTSPTQPAANEGARPAEHVAPAPSAPAPAPEPEPEKRSLASRMLGAFSGGAPTEKKRVLDDDLLEELEDLLISSDLGAETAMRISANLAASRFGKRVGATELKRLLADEVAKVLDPVAKPLPLYAKKPQVVLVVGVNGSGKTTTIGKLASQLKAGGKSVSIAAGDTFRAAAVEQLQVWGDRAGVPVFRMEQGADPASLAYEALEKAQADGIDVLLIDTAGRLQNRKDLMEELAKIVRVIRKRDETAPHTTLLVLDATTGQNAISQVQEFQKIADVSGLVMTKLDGTARGGVLVALADKIGLPIHAIGVGESIEDLQAFDPKEFAEALTGA
ncbi:MAG: signal recognition particle-docking protein FtsY [Neomegalonema sp.]|nr:signal recognition particle-docking protein FtsY [Neomegalonema sp.]